MTSNYPETDNFGLVRVGEGESNAKEGFAVTDKNWVSTDRILKALADHDHTGGARLADPAVAPDITQSPTGGTLPAGQTYYYVISYEDEYGLETAASPEVAVTTPPPLGVPTAPALSIEATGGTLVAGTYRYVLASRTAGGGLTTTSPIASIQILGGTTNRILIALPDMPVDAEALVIFRARPGQSQYYYWTESTTAADLYDDGSIIEDATILAPAYNTSSGTNSITVSVPGGVIPGGVTKWRLYRSSQPGIYNALNLVHLVSEGLTESDTVPRPSWIDDGSGLLRGQPRRTSATLAPPPAVGSFAIPTGGTAGQVLAKVDGTDYYTAWVNASSGGGGTALSSEAIRFAQERQWSVFASGTLEIGKVYAVNPNEFNYDSGATQGQFMVPRWMEAYFQTAPVVDASGSQVGFELLGAQGFSQLSGVPIPPKYLGFGGAQNPKHLGAVHQNVRIEAEDTPLLPIGRVIEDDDLASSSSGLGKGARISAQDELVDFKFDGTAAVGTIPARPWLQVDTVYYFRINLRAEAGSATPTDDLRVKVFYDSTTLLQQDYTVLSLAASDDGYYDILVRVTTPPSIYPGSIYPQDVVVRVQKMLSTTASYLIDSITAYPEHIGVNGNWVAPISLRATLVDSPDFPLPCVAFPTGPRLIAPARVYVREGIETSVDFDFWTNTFASVAWTVTSDQAWCVPTPASGTSGTDTITATVDDTGFAAGTRHVATLTLSGSGYPDTEIEVVTLMAPAVLGADASVLIRYVNA